ncbi:MAG: FG-GAP repeat domain-containing protein [Solirubrobacteraceae bacterium]
MLGPLLTATLLLLATGSASAAALFGPGVAGPSLAGLPDLSAVGDFNGDGHPDLALSIGYPSPRLEVLLGDGHGGFSPSPGSPLLSSGAPVGIAVGDFNSDGHEDLAVTDYNAGTVTVFLGDGRGGFTQAGTPVPVGIHPLTIVAGFFNPGHPEDLAVMLSGSGVAVLLGDGHGGFSPSPSSPITAVPDTAALGVGYFGGTGAADLAVAGFDGQITLLLNDGSGSFTPTSPVSTGVPASRASPEALAVGDFNGDGVDDVAVGFADGEVSVLLNQGRGALLPAPGSPVRITADTQITSLVAADVNGDGATDLVSADYFQGGCGDVSCHLPTDSVGVLLGDGHGGMTQAPGSPYLMSGVVASASTGDFEGIGRLDIAASDGNGCHGMAVEVLHNQGMNGPDPKAGTFAGDGCPLLPSSPFASCTVSGVSINPFVQGLEVTQGVQTNSFPDVGEGCGPAPGFGGLHPAAQYPHGNPFNGDGITVRYVRLVAGRKTVVRVYAAASGAQAGPPAPIVARLYAWRDGRLIPSTRDAPNPQAADNGPLSVPRGSDAPSWSERTDPTGAFQFTLPEAWAHGDLTLVAQINPPDATPSMTECTGCEVDDLFTLSGIHFIPTRPLFIRAPALIAQGETLPAPEDVFAGLRSVLPVADDGLRTPVGSYDGVLTGNASQVCDSPGITGELLKEWGALQSFGAGLSVNRTEGIYSGYRRGSDGVDCQSGETQPGVGWQAGYTGTPLPGYPYSVAAASRPLTSVAHEIFHGLGLPHAGHKCYYGNNPADTSQQGAYWPPEDQGFLQGIGTDVFSFSPTANAYRIKAAPALNAGYGQQLFDLMSYCIWDRTPGLNPTDGSDAMYRKGLAANAEWEQITWISPRTWDAIVDRLAVPGASAADQASSASAGALTPSPTTPAAAASAHPPVLDVLVSPGTSPRIDVFPGSGAPPAGAPSSYTIQTTGSDGRLSARVPLMASHVHQDFLPDETVLEAQIPSAGVASLRLLAANGSVVAERRRPPPPARVRILVPGRRTVARCEHRGCVLHVRWRPTGRTEAGLQAAMDVSDDGGRSWRTVFLGPDLGSALISERLLGYSRRERVRVRVNDGFDQVAGVSAPFLSVGSPPMVSILSPRRGERIAQDGSLYLSGEATDDSGRAITGHRLRWYLGRRLLGVGSSISPIGLTAGAARITLLAEDGRGRAGQATVALRVLAERPQFLLLRVPTSLSPRARRLLLRVSSLAPAILTVSGHGVQPVRVGVSRRLVTIRVAIGRGKGLLRLRLELASGQLHTLTRVLVRR